ncbi:MAG: hypothetical protein Q7T18_08930 [Sedimentisphaerales bacterium]|nr:hypothetical protein [Sedimentisphaerales bacterium]
MGKSTTFPIPKKGLYANSPASQQPLETSPHLNNVRPYDAFEGRLRLGQRPGMIRKFGQKIGSGSPVVAICQITTVEW